jgi:SpoVK/Ycf46/Vps4 family AAA+-type ATPase
MSQATSDPSAVGAGALHPFAASVRAHIRAGYPLLYVVTPEEERAIELIRQAAAPGAAYSRSVYIWSITRGLCGPDMKRVDRGDSRPELLLPALLESAEQAVFILEDFHYYLDERSSVAPTVIRQLRDLVGPFKSSRKTAVILSPILKLPAELEKDMTVLDLDPLGQQELLAVLEETVELVKSNPKVEINLEPGDRERMVKSLQGLTKGEAENALAKLVVTTSRIDAEDLSLLVAEKEQVIRKSGILEYYSTPERFGQIGGLDELKRWLRERERGFTEAARQFGLPSPKGLLLVGVPGCGKSLSAKAVGAEWQMPLLKFDLGKVFASLVGQAEENMRRALKMAEAVAPCILWIDEIEKGLSGTSGGGDSGVSARVFGTFLTWMEENRRPVFTIATANDVDGLPPELLRKGRFDEVFFIDLPTPAERANILAIHLSRHHRDYRDFDIAGHADAAEDFSGAELEQVVISALYAAFAEGDATQLADRHIQAAIAATVPLSKSMGARIKTLREEARIKWRHAGLAEQAPVQDAAAPRDIPTPAAKPRRVFEV